MIDPETREEWQEAVDAAHVCLAIDSARKYGLIVTSLAIDEGRCLETIRRGALYGVSPSDDAIERLLG